MMSVFFCGPTMNSSASVSDVGTLVKDDKYEDNDILEDAYTGLADGVWLADVDGFGISNDADWFQVAVASSGNRRIKIECLFTHNEGDIDIVLFDLSGNVIGQDAMSSTDNEYLNVVVPSAGIYCVKVWNRFGYTGNNYNLRWRSFPEDNYEPNNSLAGAFTGLPKGVWLSSVDGPGYQGDVDWYKTVVADDTKRRIVVDCTFTHSEGDINIALYNFSGTQLYFNSTTNDNEQIDFVVPSTGTYYVRVTSFEYMESAYDLCWNTMTYSAPTLLSLSITGANQVFEYDNAQYICTATYSDDSTSDVTAEAGWSVDKTQYASISSSGELTAESVSSDHSVIVTALFGGKSTTKYVLIKDVPPTVIDLIIEGPSEVEENSSATYTCTATWSDLTYSDITASAVWATESPYASVNSGLLETLSVSANEFISITVEYGGQSAYKNVTIVPYFAEPVSYWFWTFQQEIPPELSGYEDTPADDGIPNLLKYACGLPAREACSYADLMTIVKGASDGMFSIIYNQAESAVEVDLEVISSLSLTGEWSVVESDWFGQEGDIQQLKASIPLSNEKGFMRLRAIPLDPGVMGCTSKNSF